MACEDGVDVPLHKQLDRIEQLRAQQGPAAPHRERLRQLCEDLYGPEVPASWLDQALAPSSSHPGSDATAVVTALTPATPASTDRSFRALMWWSHQRYERPGSREEWQARRAVLDRLHQKWDAVENLCVFLVLIVAVVGIPVGAGVAITEMHSKGPVLILAALVPGLVASGICWLGSRLGKRLVSLRQLMRRYRKVKISEEKWKKWMKIPGAPPLLLAWLDHDVPLLKGDLKHLRQLRKQAKHHRQREALRQDLRASSEPA